MTDMTIAKTILAQIKTIDPWAMNAWGAKDLVGKESGLQFKSSGMVKWKGIVSVNYIAGADHYDLEFGKIRKYEYKVTKKVEGVYADQLVELIDGVVG
ncbi:hypothetical protein OAA38_00210 [bacterium]|jgi:hypothetical protein|nr:hypothetical protein [bacterium]|tara:strand:+ start:1406 stop:1699 length:294 start_codon:yes stop_codon:yes gene_type:complete